MSRPMPPRPLANATISFGLVTVPVKLFSANQPSAGISFNMVHAKCGTRLKQQYWCPKDEEVVDRNDIVKGYEFSKGQYVLFNPDELKALEEVSRETIEITEFVPADQVDPVYYEKAYYLGPDKGGDRAYRLLGEAMRQTGVVALGKYAARGKQYLVMLRPKDDGIILEQLYYADEVRSFSEVPLGEGKVKDAEVKLAVQLIEQTRSGEFRPQDYKDEVKERVQELIQRKVEGEEIVAAAEPEPEAKIIDIMDALKASLAKKKGAAAEAGDDEEERKPPKRAKAKSAGRKNARKVSSG